MLKGEQLGAAIDAARIKKKLSKKALAERFGVKPPSVQGWIGTGRIDKSKIFEMITFFSDVVPPSHWGLSAEIGVLLDEAHSTSRGDAGVTVDNLSSGQLVGLTATPGHHRLTDRPGFIEIPQLDVHGSMGSGAIRPEIVDVIQRMTVSMDFLRQSVTFSKPDNLALITGYGDSMEGTFNDGDLLLVDRGVNDVKIDAVYVLSLNDELYIKRLQRRGDGTFTMISDNRKYEPIPVSEKDLARFQVLGRVLLAWNARKL